MYIPVNPQICYGLVDAVHYLVGQCNFLVCSSLIRLHFFPERQRDFSIQLNFQPLFCWQKHRDQSPWHFILPVMWHIFCTDKSYTVSYFKSLMLNICTQIILLIVSLQGETAFQLWRLHFGPKVVVNLYNIFHCILDDAVHPLLGS